MKKFIVYEVKGPDNLQCVVQLEANSIVEAVHKHCRINHTTIDKVVKVEEVN